MEHRLDLSYDDLTVISDAVRELLVREKEEIGDSLEEMEASAQNILHYARVLNKIDSFLESMNNDEESSAEETTQEAK